MLDVGSPCTRDRSLPRRRHRGVVRTRVETIIAAPRDRLVALLMDYVKWPRIFGTTIADAELVGRDRQSLVVAVGHRSEGRVVNVLTNCGDGVIVLREFKRRYDATFVNSFEHDPAGTRYRIDAEVRLEQPFALLAPLLGGVVRRALRRYTVQPLREAALRTPLLAGRSSWPSHTGLGDASDSAEAWE